MMAKRTLLIDLDGTLVDPAQGIITGCQKALTALGRPEPDYVDLNWVIGPPLRQTFAALLGGTGQVEDALAHYRTWYSEHGIFRATRYEGIMEALAAMKGQGTKLCLCTSKPRVFAERVVGHFGFADFFDGLYGSELDGRFDDKGDLIQHILQAEELSADQGCMIGDRKHDILAANRHGMKSVGVLWGYGGLEELQTAGATAICGHPSEMPDTALRLFA